MKNSSIKLPDQQSYAQLEVGRCHYRFDGPKTGKLLLLIHGATVAGWIFEQLRPFLINSNFRLLTVDLLGHGYSERLDIEYDIDLYVRQITELFASIDELDNNTPVNVLGHSLGAAIAVSLANLKPYRFNRVILTAPLINFVENMPIVKLVRVPILGELINKLYTIPMLKRRRRKRYAPIAGGRFIDKFMSQFLIPGFERTVLSLFRSDILFDKTKLYQQFSLTQLPSLVIYGEQDELVTLEQINHLRRLLPKSQYLGLPGAGHAFVLSEPERIADQIANFLESEPVKD